VLLFFLDLVLIVAFPLESISGFSAYLSSPDILIYTFSAQVSPLLKPGIALLSVAPLWVAGLFWTIGFAF